MKLQPSGLVLTNQSISSKDLTQTLHCRPKTLEKENILKVPMFLESTQRKVSTCDLCYQNCLCDILQRQRLLQRLLVNAAFHFIFLDFFFRHHVIIQAKTSFLRIKCSAIDKYYYHPSPHSIHSRGAHFWKKNCQIELADNFEQFFIFPEDLKKCQSLAWLASLILLRRQEEPS